MVNELDPGADLSPKVLCSSSELQYMCSVPTDRPGGERSGKKTKNGRETRKGSGSKKAGGRKGARAGEKKEGKKENNKRKRREEKRKQEKEARRLTP